MRSKILAVTAGASFALAAVSAQAMPAAPVASNAAPEVTLVAGGCGPGWHRGPYGRCVRNFYRPYAYYPAYGYGYYRPYARCGVRIGPLGIGGPC